MNISALISVALDSFNSISQIHSYAAEALFLVLALLSAARLVLTDWSALSEQWRRAARQRQKRGGS